MRPHRLHTWSVDVVPSTPGLLVNVLFTFRFPRYEIFAKRDQVPPPCSPPSKKKFLSCGKTDGDKNQKNRSNNNDFNS